MIAWHVVYHSKGIMTSVHIFGVRVDSLSRGDFKKKIADFLHAKTQHTIFTPNPEMLLAARRDTVFRLLLNNGSLNICDGRGIQFVVKEPIERIPGVDAMLDICREAAKKGKKIYLLGSRNQETVIQTRVALESQFPGIQIAGGHPGVPLCVEKNVLATDEKKDKEIIEDIRHASPDVLFVAFGHNKQERWIERSLHSLPSVKIAMGVGGAFDFVSGRVRRAPRCMRSLGLEWLWRLFRQPWRVGRIFRAAVVFPVYYYFSKK